MNRNEEIAREFADACLHSGWYYAIDGGTLSISKTFEPGNRDHYVACDGEAYHLLAIVPQSRPGSTWGTDGGSVGGAIGLEQGRYTLHRSGMNRNVLAAIKRLR